MNLIVEQISGDQVVHENENIRQSGMTNRVFVKIDQVALIEIWDLLTQLLEVIPKFTNERGFTHSSNKDEFPSLLTRIKPILKSLDFEGDFTNLMRINVVWLRTEYKELFWNLIYYFSFFDYNFTFMLPYIDDLWESVYQRKKSL